MFARRPGFAQASGARNALVAHDRQHFLPPFVPDMLYVDGVYTFDDVRPRLHRGCAPAQTELQRLLHTIAIRVARALEKQGLLLRDDDTPSLDLEPAVTYLTTTTLPRPHRYSSNNADRRVVMPILNPVPVSATLRYRRRHLNSTLECTAGRIHRVRPRTQLLRIVCHLRSCPITVNRAGNPGVCSTAVAAAPIVLPAGSADQGSTP